MLGGAPVGECKRACLPTVPIIKWMAVQHPVFRRRLATAYGVLVVLNCAAWAWAIVCFHHRPALLGIAFVTYGLGLRHAVDADHIAAIDNVTRKLMQSGQRPAAVGLFFALGHASVVVIISGAVAEAVNLLGTIRSWQMVGEFISTGVSAVFLFAVATMNIAIFVGIYANYRRLRSGLPFRDEDLGLLLSGRGFLSRIMRPLFGLITRSWQMLILGLLFGLGFDTATEVAVFGVSATQAARGIPIVDALSFPLLFAAGMALIDTTDGVMMLGAYDWAFVRPIRKLYYNMFITAVSVAVALVIGAAEVLGLARRLLNFQGRFWDLTGALTGDMNLLGLITIGLFAVTWLVSRLIYNMRCSDEISG